MNKLNCKTCNKEFEKPYNCSIKSWNKRQFCSCECRYKSQIGKKHSEEHKENIGKSLKGKCAGKKHWNFKHGMRPKGKWNRFYKIWGSMKERCLNKNNPNYFRYGGREITICKTWLNFTNFYNDMYKSYLKHCKDYGIKDTSIDRINNSKGYYPKNCHWATHREQSNNTSSNRMITFNNETMSLSNWARELKIKRYILQNRLNSNWSFEKAINTPIKIISKHQDSVQ